MTFLHSPIDLKGWQQSYLSIIFGDQPTDVVTLQSLAKLEVLSPLVARVAAFIAADQRQAALTILHYAIGTITETILAPLALDAVTIKMAADQFGFVLKEDGALSKFWVRSDIQFQPGIQVAALGADLSAVLMPIVKAVQIAGQVHERGVELVMFDAIYRGCQQLERAYPVQVDRGWIEVLLKTMGDSSPLTYRTFEVQPDDGAPISMTIPRVCCVLSRKATPHSCPTCPLHSAVARRQITEDWLRSLDDAGFYQTTGRARIEGNLST